VKKEEEIRSVIDGDFAFDREYLRKCVSMVLLPRTTCSLGFAKTRISFNFQFLHGEVVITSTNHRQTKKLKMVTVFFSFAHRLKCICGKKK
jgi:hypothetical protein